MPKTKRYIPSNSKSLLKGALYDSKDTRIYELAQRVQKYVDEFLPYDKNSVGREAVILHYKDEGPNAKLIGIEFSIVDVGNVGPVFIDVYIKQRRAHLGSVPVCPYPLRVKREGNRLYRYLLPFDARSKGAEDDEIHN